MKPQTTRWAALVVATLVVLYLCWMMIQPLVDVLLWAIVLAIIFFPAFDRLRERGWKPYSAALATTTLVVLTVLIPLTFLAIAMLQQGASAAQTLQQAAARLLDPESPGRRWLNQYVDVNSLLDPKTWGARGGAVSGVIAGRTLSILGVVMGTLVQVLMVPFTLYYLFRDSDRIRPMLQGLLPLSHEDSAAIFKRTEEVIIATVNGVLVIAAIQGFLGMLAFLILGLPSPLLWGAVMFICATIPMAGTFIVWVPAAVYLAATGSWGKAIFLTAWGSLIIGTLDNFLRPKLVGKRAGLHELVIFFSVLGGLSVFGVLGLFVGPVVAAIAIALLDVLRKVQAGEIESRGADSRDADSTSGESEPATAQTAGAGPVRIEGAPAADSAATPK